MNQRLIELYRSVRPMEALKSQDIYESANVLIGSEVEKFAELIVREYSYDCMDVTSNSEHIEFVAKKWGVEL